MIFSLDLRISGLGNMKRSELNAIHKEAFYLVALKWRQFFLPKHFGPRATQRYGYKPRSYRYNVKKKLLVGHQRPLEYTGEGRRLALSEENIYSTSNKGVARLPRKFNLRPKEGIINMADEIRAVRPDEARELTRLFVGYVRAALRASGARRARVSHRVTRLAA